MDKETIFKKIEMLGYTPSTRPVNKHVERIWAAGGGASRSLGYLSSLEQMPECKLVDWINYSFARKAR